MDRSFPMTASTSTPPVKSTAAAKPKPGAASTWSLRPVARPSVPAVKNRDWCRNPIDAFLLARLEAEGLQPAPEADRVTLIRRLKYDLTGLPPTPKRSTRSSPIGPDDAYERLVDRLLASPHYGEKWGRHWLDLVRYAETNGYERDSAKPFAWRYRDYVIDAFNHDKPYDQFIREQLAGDEIDPGSAAALIATGYYRLGIWDDEPADRPLARYDGLDGIISTTGQVILGMTDQLRPLPRSQGRPDSPERLLPAAGFLSGHRRPQRQEPEESRPSRPGSANRGHVRRGAGPARHARPVARQSRTCRVTRSSPACPRS